MKELTILYVVISERNLESKFNMVHVYNSLDQLIVHLCLLGNNFTLKKLATVKQEG